MLSQPIALSPTPSDDTEVVEIKDSDDLDHEIYFNHHKTKLAKGKKRPHRKRTHTKNQTHHKQRRLSTLSGLNESAADEAEKMIAREKKKLERRMRNFAKDDSNPAKWMYKSFSHPIHGKKNYDKVEKAAIRIQTIFRGRRARNQFLYMYENKDVLYNLGTYLFFMCVVMLYISFKKTSLDGFLMQDLLRDLFLDEEFSQEDTQIYKSFHDVASREEFWQYMHGPLSNGLFPDDCYEQVRHAEAQAHSQNITFKPTTEDFPCIGLVYTSDMLMGGVRLYTFRAENSDWRETAGATCRAPPQMQDRLDNLGCFPPWGSAIPETDPNYLMSGLTTNRTKKQQDDIHAYDGLESCFTKELSDTINWYPFASQSGIQFKYFGLNSIDYYPRDSYACEMLYTDGHTFGQRLKAMESSEWIDSHTRAVMIEFSFINPNIGMTTSVRLFFEFLASGGVVNNYNFATSWLFSLYPWTLNIIYTGYIIVLLMFCFGYLHSEFAEMSEAGVMKYFSDITNVADLLNYFLLMIVLAVDVFAQQEERRALSSMGTPDDPKYVNYVAVNYLNDMGNWLQSFNFIILTLKLFKYFKVSPKLNIMIETVLQAGSTLAYFVLILALTTGGFAFAFYCAFNSELDDFNTIDHAIGTLLFGILGESVDFRDISGANRVLAPMFHFTFTFVVSILFFSLFITMIDEAYQQVKEAQAKNSADITSDILAQRASILKRRMIKHIKRLSLCLCPCLPALYNCCCSCNEIDEEEEILQLERELSPKKFLRQVGSMRHHGQRVLAENATIRIMNGKGSNGKGDSKRFSIFGNLFGSKHDHKGDPNRGKGAWVKSWQKRRKLEEKKRDLLAKHAQKHRLQKHKSYREEKMKLMKQMQADKLAKGIEQRKLSSLNLNSHHLSFTDVVTEEEEFIDKVNVQYQNHLTAKSGTKSNSSSSKYAVASSNSSNSSNTNVVAPGNGGELEIDWDAQEEEQDQTEEEEMFKPYVHSDTSESERSGSGTDVEEYGEKNDAQVNALLKDDNEMDRQRSMSNDFKFKKMLSHFRQVEKKRDEDTAQRFSDIMKMLQQQQAFNGDGQQGLGSSGVTRPGRTTTATTSKNHKNQKNQKNLNHQKSDEDVDNNKFQNIKDDRDVRNEDEEHENNLNLHLEQINDDVYGALEQHGGTESFVRENKVEGSVLYFGNQ